jgi:hypothetical protein
MQHLDEEKIMTVVSPEKDVEGFHPLNMGNLAMRGMEPLFIPCASNGCIELLLRFGVEIIGKKIRGDREKQDRWIAYFFSVAGNLYFSAYTLYRKFLCPFV